MDNQKIFACILMEKKLKKKYEMNGKLVKYLMYDNDKLIKNMLVI